MKSKLWRIKVAALTLFLLLPVLVRASDSSVESSNL